MIIHSKGPVPELLLLPGEGVYMSARKTLRIWLIGMIFQVVHPNEQDQINQVGYKTAHSQE